MTLKNLTSLFRKLDYIFTNKIYYLNPPVFIGRNHLSDYDGIDWKIYIPKKRINLESNGYDKIYIPYPKTAKNRDYELALICWYPNSSSNIHNHAKGGCAFKVLESQLIESQYNFKYKNFEKTFENKLYKNNTKYIENTYYYHKMTNSDTKTAYSLHLYSPPNGKRNQET